MDQKQWNKIRKGTDHLHSSNVRHVKVPMSDGVELAATLFTPKKGTSWPVVVVRSPYVINNMLYDLLYGELFPRHGYAQLLVDVRGTQDSDGEWDPMVNERQDGFDTIDWVGEQSWCDGNIATYGGSYLGYTQWAILDCDNPKLKTQYIDVFGNDPMQMQWRRGMFRQEVATMWAAQMMGENRLKVMMGKGANELYEKAYRVVPQVELGEQLMGEPCDWYKTWVTKPDPMDPFWNEGTFGAIRAAAQKATRPVAFHSGWWDIFLRMTLQSWRDLPEGIREQSHFLIGPWVHQGITNGELKYPGESKYGLAAYKDVIRWFDYMLKGEPYDGTLGEFEAYCIGDDGYHSLEGDLPETRKEVFYLGDHTLKKKAPRKKGSYEYDYDPEDPVPSTGGQLIAAASCVCQEKPGYRGDVISFVSPKQKKSMTLAGSMTVELYVASDAPATAFTVKVMEVKGGPKGKAYNIRNDITDIRWVDETTYKDYKPGTVRKLTIELCDIYWKLEKGSAIRVDISSSCFPEYHVHKNTAKLWSEETESHIAHQTVFYGGKTASKITLPIEK